MDYIKNLDNFAYYTWDIIMHRLRKMLKYCCIRPKFNRKDKLFSKGVKHLTKQFEITHILASLRSVELLSSIILSKYQEFLVPYFKHNILTIETKDIKAHEKKTQSEKLHEKIVKQQKNKKKKMFTRPKHLSKEE